MNEAAKRQACSGVIDFWFPEGHVAPADAHTHRAQWRWRMRGGAHDAITARFTDLTADAAARHLDAWARDPHGRLALIVVLDQFSRSVWRGTARAYAQDAAALSLALDGIGNGHYAALTTPWHRIVFGLPLGHCESPRHLEHVDLLIRLREDIAAHAPPHLRPVYESLAAQARKVRQVIAAFGRHPHRNAVLGRVSTAAEEAYIGEGRFPHLEAFDT